MRIHHRNIPYRPPRHEREGGPTSFETYRRFFRAYLRPYGRALAFCAFWWSLRACLPYVMAFYSRIVVDSILRVRAETPAVSAVPIAEVSRAERERSVGVQRPRELASVPRLRDRPPPAARAPGAAGRLAGMFFLYIGTLAAANVITRIETRIRLTIGQRMTGRLREDLHHKVLRLSLSYHRAHSPGRLMARILSDVEHVQEQMISTILTLVSSALSVTVGFAILLTLEPRMALIVAIAIPFYAFFQIRTRVFRRQITHEIRHTNSWMYALASQKLDAIKVIQAYSRERHEELNFHRLSACYLRDTLLQQRVGAALGRAAGIVSALGTGLLFLYGTRRVLAGELTLGAMMYAYGAAANLFQPVNALSQINLTVTRLLVILERLTQVLDEPEQIRDAPDARPLPVPLRQGITILNLHFGYPHAPEPLLEDILLRVPAGQWLCVMGPSGVGKTTLLYLLSRLLLPDDGEIFYDDVPLGKIRMADLRRHISLVPQEPQIFSGTIRDNICYGFPEATPAQIVAAAKAADIHDFIMTLPVRYETIIGEKGASLSGGQRQRLSLARALITDPEVLLLDDCTSALDADTEERIQQTLARLLRGKTAVIVSQRVSMARRCHRVAVLRHGIIEEIGTHEELCRAGGFYQQLCRQQLE